VQTGEKLKQIGVKMKFQMSRETQQINYFGRQSKAEDEIAKWDERNGAKDGTPIKE
jgi:hypothetical protein